MLKILRIAVSMYKSFLSVKFWTQSFLPWFFLNLALFQIFSMSQTFSIKQLTLGQIQKKSRQNWLSPNLTLRKFSVFKNLCSKKHKYFLKHLEKSWNLVIFALIFSEFGYVPRKSLGHRKNLEHSQIQKKSRQKWLSPKLDT